MPPWLVRILPIISAFLTGAISAAEQSLSGPGTINWYAVAAWALVGGVLNAGGLHLPAPAQQVLVDALIRVIEKQANQPPAPPVTVVTPPAVIPPAPATVPLSGKPAAAPLQSVTQGAPPAVSIPTVQTPTTVTVGPPVVVSNAPPVPAPAEPPNG